MLCAQGRGGEKSLAPPYRSHYAFCGEYYNFRSRRAILCAKTQDSGLDEVLALRNSQAVGDRRRHAFVYVRIIHMLRWFLAKLSIIRKFFNFGDDSDNSDDNDNKNGAIPSIRLSLFRDYYIYKYIYIYIYIYSKICIQYFV